MTKKILLLSSGFFYKKIERKKTGMFITNKIKPRDFAIKGDTFQNFPLRCKTYMKITSSLVSDNSLLVDNRKDSDVVILVFANRIFLQRGRRYRRFKVAENRKETKRLLFITRTL